MMRSLFTAFAVIILGVATATAQSSSSEIQLKQFFEGKQVIVKIDMPATKDGVNVYAERSPAMNFGEYAQRLKRHGISVRAGESIMITKIKVKEKHIEFQLGGGGYGTVGDETSSSVYVPSVGKSRRERRLEDELKRETDSRRRREIRDEIDYLRREREREDRRNQVLAAEAEEAKRARIEQKALQGGSRFNIQFERHITARELTPAVLIQALEKFVDFSDIGDAYSINLQPSRPADLPTIYLKTGLSPQEVTAFLGRPEKITEHVEGDARISTYIFARNEGRLFEAEFVNGALVRTRFTTRDAAGLPLIVAN